MKRWDGESFAIDVVLKNVDVREFEEKLVRWLKEESGDNDADVLRVTNERRCVSCISLGNYHYSGRS